MNPASKKFKTILATLLIIILVLSIFAAIQTTNNINKQQVVVSDDAPLEVDNKPTKEFYKAIETKKYQELKERAPGIVTSPNIINEEVRNEADKSLNFSKIPSNNIVKVENGKLSQSLVVIPTGNLVTWVNESDQEITIKGVDNWGSMFSVKPGNRFSQMFDFVGQYNYYIEENSEVQGTIEVVLVAK